MKFYNAKFSETYIEQQKKEFDQYWFNNKLPVVYSYTDTAHSKIIVGLESFDELSKLKQRFPANIFKFEQAENTSAQKNAYRAVDEYRTPFMAGQQIYKKLPNGYIGTCTGSFMYKKGSSAFQVTAGHCFNYGDSVYTGDTQIGRTSSVIYGINVKADVEAIAIPAEHARDYMFGTTNGDQNYFGGVEYQSSEVIGEKVCLFGSMSKLKGLSMPSCGTLERKDYTTTYKDSQGNVEAVISNMRVASYKTIGGDSGGPVFNTISGSERRILGVNSGHYFDSAGNEHALYSHVSNVADALNFSYSDIIFRR